MKEIPVLNVIRTRDEIYLYAHGSMRIVGTSMLTDNGMISLEATDYLEVLPAYHVAMSFDHVETSRFQFTATASLNEVSVGFGCSIDVMKTSMMTATPIASVMVGNVHLVAKNILTSGVIAEGKTFHVRAHEKWVDKPADAIYLEKVEMRYMEVGVKIGIRTSLGSFVNSLSSAADGVSSGEREGLTNAGFAGYAAYLTGVDMLDRGPSLGGWLYLNMQSSSSNLKTRQVVPSYYNFDEIFIEADELDFYASQFSAYNAYIKAQNVFWQSSKNTMAYHQQSMGFNAEVGISDQGVSGSLGANAGHSQAVSESHLHFAMNVRNNLTMHVTGVGRLSGVTIAAKTIDLFFGDLFIESVKDMYKNSASFAGMGISIGKKDVKLSSLQGGYEKGLREAVHEVSSIIGEDQVHIVVAHALTINGAMISNAKRGADGQLDDLGNLQMIAGQLFVNHIKLVVGQVSFAASMEFGRKVATNEQMMQGKEGDSNNAYRLTFGVQRGDGLVLGTIGNGELIVTNGEIPAQLNRDIKHVDTGIDYSANIKSIHMFIKERDQLQEARVFGKFSLQASKRQGAFPNIQGSERKAYRLASLMLSDVTKNEQLGCVESEGDKVFRIEQSSAADNARGYFGAAYADKDIRNMNADDRSAYQGQIFLVNRQTSTDSWIELLKDLAVDFAFVTKSMPSQYDDARSYALQVQARYPKAEIILAGFSLGGALSEILSFDLGWPCMIVDSPAVGGIIRKMFSANGDELKQYASVNVKSFVSLPNLVNNLHASDHLAPPLPLDIDYEHRPAAYQDQSYLEYVHQAEILKNAFSVKTGEAMTIASDLRDLRGQHK
jgi:hypothetical protein